MFSTGGEIDGYYQYRTGIIMKEIRILPVTKKNWYQCTRLSITEKQKEFFPAGVVYWLAESKFETSYIPLSIYLGEVLIGFCTIGVEPETSFVWIIAFLIDKNYQGKGYGRKSLNELIEFIRDKYDTDSITIGHRPENLAADNLYSSLGFTVISKSKNEILWRITF